MGMETIEKRTEVEKKPNGRNSFMSAYLKGVEIVMLDHVFSGLDFHLIAAATVLESVPFKRDEFLHFYDRLKAALVDNHMHGHLHYVVSTEYLDNMLKELQAFLMPTLIQLVSSIEGDEKSKANNKVLNICYGIIGGVEAIYSTYFFSRYRVFKELDSISHILDVPFDTIAIHNLPEVSHQLDWSELNQYSPTGSFPYDPLTALHIFVEFAALGVISDLFSSYDGGKFIDQLEERLQADVFKTLELIGDCLFSICGSKEFDEDAIDKAIESFTWLHEVVGTAVDELGQAINCFMYRDRDHMIDDRLNRVSLLFHYYQFMFEHYVYEECNEMTDEEDTMDTEDNSTDQKEVEDIQS